MAFTKLVIVNGHGGNATTLGAALRELFAGRQRVFVALVETSTPYADQIPALGIAPGDHASEAEVSLAPALFPKKVPREKAAVPREAPRKLKGLRTDHVSFVRLRHRVSDKAGVATPRTHRPKKFVGWWTFSWSQARCCSRSSATGK